jgi:hypothetical protein
VRRVWHNGPVAVRAIDDRPDLAPRHLSAPVEGTRDTWLPPAQPVPGEIIAQRTTHDILKRTS